VRSAVIKTLSPAEICRITSGEFQPAASGHKDYFDRCIVEFGAGRRFWETGEFWLVSGVKPPLFETALILPQVIEWIPYHPGLSRLGLVYCPRPGIFSFV
jgi:hypothetical protein